MATSRPLREVNGLIARATIGYLRRVGGEQAVEHVRRRLGAEQALFETRYSNEWVQRDHTLALALAVAGFTGDLDLGRLVGEELFDVHRSDGTADFLLAAGSPAAAMEVSTRFAHKLTSCCDCQLIHGADGQVIVETVCSIGGHTHDDLFFCCMNVGYMSQIPTLFGGRASAVHSRCHGRGDPSCQIELRWELGLTIEAEVREAHRTEAKRSITRFEEVQAVAADFAKAQTVEEVLKAIVSGVDVAAVAPKVGLAVRVPGETEPRVHLLGFEGAEAEGAEVALSAGLLPDGGEPLAVPLRSGGFDFGELVAVFRPGARIASNDRRLLEAYAGHAASALESAVNREEIRRHKEAADDLLRLAASLARLRTPGDVLSHLLGELVSLTGSVRGAAFEPDGRNFLRCATHGDTDESSPLAAVVAGPSAAAALDSEEVSACSVDGTPLVVVPLALHGHRLGVLVAERPAFSDGEDLVRRLDGLAHHGALALSNAQLLEQVSHRASHDALTGLPNRQFAADAAAEALARAKDDGTHVGLLFVDLDRFKEVNDTLGHAVGDALLSAVSARLARCTRPGDMVARLGGDEFLIMLPRLTAAKEAVRVAKRVTAALRETFVIRGRDILISSSVGVAIGPDDGDTYERLVARADEAMYEAKSAGRDGFVLAGDIRALSA